MKTAGKWFLYCLAIVAVGVIVILAFPPVVEWMHEMYFSPEDPVSDVFEGVAAFFSALAFGLLILTVILQAYELSLQRNELEETRKVFTQQAETLDVQQFETTFFNLLSLHGGIVRGLVLVDRSVNTLSSNRGQFALGSTVTRYEGREALPVILNQIREEAEKLREADGITDLEEAYRTAYAHIFTRNRDLLGHYFRNLYHVVKFVDKHGTPDQKQYTNFVRAQLSGSELELLFYNCKSEWGQGFYPLIIKYALLEHLPVGENVPVRLLPWYPDEAYEGNVALLHHRCRFTADPEGDGPPNRSTVDEDPTR